MFRAATINVKNKTSLNLIARFSSKDAKQTTPQFNDQQAPYYTAKDIEFCPNRSREVMQNYVKETSENIKISSASENKNDSVSSKPMSGSERDHLEAYQAQNSVSLYSVMQSNVPEPFSTTKKAPTHLNMPGSSSSQGYKYLSGKMQKTHQSKQ